MPVIHTDNREISIGNRNIIEVFHTSMPTCAPKLFMFPYGLYYNRGLSNAKQGDIIHTADDKYYIIKDKFTVNLDTEAGRFFARYIYQTTIENIIQRWEHKAVIDGNSRNVFNHDKCLIIQYDKIISR